MKQKHISALDGLRGIACLMILVGHFLHANSHSVSDSWILWSSQYWSGVDLFFVLSGFVIFLSLTRLREKYNPLGVMRSYFTSRAFRILPIYWALILAYFYIPFNNHLMNSDLFVSSVPSTMYLFFGQSWWMVAHHRAGAGFVGPTWSLCAEEFLYIIILLMVCFIPSRHLIKAMAATALTSLALRIHTVVTGGNLVGAYLLPTCRMDGFMLGGIIALLYSRDQLTWVNTRILNWVIAIFATTFVAMSYNNVNLYGRFAITFAYSFYAVFFASILIRILKGGTFGWLSKGPLAYVGTISYSVYLFHFPIVYAMSYACLNRIPVALNFLLTLSICLTISTISWYWMEKKLIARGKIINERIVEKSVQLTGLVWQF